MQENPNGEWFKVVRRQGNLLVSAFVGGDTQVIYRVGEFAIGKYPLFIFGSLYSAERFSFRETIFEIWKVETLGSIFEIKRVLPAIRDTSLLSDDLDDYWRNGGGFADKNYFCPAPTSTFCVPQVKLVKRVS